MNMNTWIWLAWCGMGVALVPLGCGGETSPTVAKPNGSGKAGNTRKSSSLFRTKNTSKNTVEVRYVGGSDAEQHITSFLKIYFPEVKRNGADWLAVIHTLPPSAMGYAGNNAVLMISKTAHVRYDAAKQTVRFQVIETKKKTVLSQASHDVIVTRHQRFWETYPKLTASRLAREFAPLEQ